MVLPARPFKWRPHLGSYQQSKTAEECKAFPILIPVSFYAASSCTPAFFLSHLPTILPSGFFLILHSQLKKKIKVEEAETILVISLFPSLSFPSLFDIQ